MAGGLLQLQMLAQEGQEESTSSMAALSESPSEGPSQGQLRAVNNHGDASIAAGGSKSLQLDGVTENLTEAVSTDNEAGAAIEGVIQALLDEGMG